MESRWLRWVGPGLIAFGAFGSIATVTLGAGRGPWAPPPCGDGTSALAAVASVPAPTSPMDLARQPWFRLDPIINRAGELEGQRVALGLDGVRSVRTIALPAESFVAGPFGRVVLAGGDDGATSHLQAIDVAAGCSWAIADESAVVRRATMDAAGLNVYEMRVDRASRADLGIWQRPVDPSRPPTRILEPIAPDERFGPTFTTEFAWDLTGELLAVQSCGEAACRTRVIDPADGGSVEAIAEPDLGTLVALDGTTLVTYGACPGLPCPVVAIDLRTRARQTLAEAAAVAVAVTTPDGPRLVHEVFDEAGVALREVSLDGTSVTDLGHLPIGVRLHANPVIAQAATRVPGGWVLLASDGRIPPDGPDPQTQLRHIPDGSTVPLDEVTQ